MKTITLNPIFERPFEGRFDLGFNDLWNLVSEETVSSQRTSSVTIVRLPDCLSEDEDGRTRRGFLKKYWYPTFASRLKGFFRNTFFGMSRAAREFGCLSRLNDLGCSIVRPLAVGEHRTLRLLQRAFILTEEIPGTLSLEQFLRSAAFNALPLAGRRELAARLGCWVRALHDRGFRDRDLHPRNVLVHAGGGAAAFSKIDSGAASGGRTPPGSGRIFERDLVDLHSGVRALTSRQDRLRFLLAYLAAPRVDAEVRFTLARLVRDPSCPG
jgi:hypothetical protein